MNKILLLGAAIAVSASVSHAAEVAPQDVAYNMDSFTVDTPLTDTPGDPVAGRNLVIDRKKGNCLACHVMPIEEQLFHGEVGPSLWGVGETYSVPELRFRVANYRKLNPEAIMPGYYRDPAEIVRPLKDFEGKTVLTAQEVEDIVAYIATLKTYQN